MDSSFNVHLASNVAREMFPKNCASEFKTPLAEEIHLDGKWEVAVKDIMHPTNISTTSEEDKIHFHKRHWNAKLNLPFQMVNGAYKHFKEELDIRSKVIRLPTIGKPLMLDYQHEGKASLILGAINDSILVRNKVLHFSYRVQKVHAYAGKKDDNATGNPIIFTLKVLKKDIVVIMEPSWAKFLGFVDDSLTVGNCFTDVHDGIPVPGKNFENENIPSSTFTFKVYEYEIMLNQMSTFHEEAAPTSSKPPPTPKRLTMKRKKDEDETISAAPMEKVVITVTASSSLQVQPSSATNPPVKVDEAKVVKTHIMKVDKQIKVTLRFDKYQVEIETFKNHKFVLLSFSRYLRNQFRLPRFCELKKGAATKITLNWNFLPEFKSRRDNAIATYDFKQGHFIVYEEAILASIEESISELPTESIELVSHAKFLSAKDFLPLMNEKSQRYQYEFVFDEASNRFHLHIKGDEYAIKLSKSLLAILGFDFSPNEEVVFERKQIYKAKHVAFLNRGIDHLYVYSNIVDSSYVGNTKVPLLLICPFKRELYGNIHQEFLNPTYKPIIRKSIYQIDIHIYDDAGEKVPFLYGKTVLNLHFRKCTV
jgi:hypothetical protein